MSFSENLGSLRTGYSFGFRPISFRFEERTK